MDDPKLAVEQPNRILKNALHSARQRFIKAESIERLTRVLDQSWYSLLLGYHDTKTQS